MSSASFTPAGAELRLRPYQPDYDSQWWIGPGETPPLVLELLVAGEALDRLAFWSGEAAVKAFHSSLIEEFSHKHMRQSVFDTLSDADQRAKLPALAHKTRRFLREALSEAGLARLNVFLDGLPEAGVLRASSDGTGEATVFWAVLHPGELPADRSAAPLGFLGTRFILVQSAYGGETQTLGMPAIDVFRQRRRRLGLVDDPALKAVQDSTERNALRQYGGEGFDPLHRLEADGAEPGEPTLGSMQELVAYLAYQRRHAVHFACHGRRIEDRFAIRVRRDQDIDATELCGNLYEMMFRILGRRGQVSADLLFLNICGSAGTSEEWPNPLESMGLFGSKAVIGAIANVCDQSAAAFAKDFYDRACGAGDGVGEAFSAATRHAVTTTRNPTNLVFAMAGDPGARLS